MEVFEVSDHPLWNCSLLVVVGGDQHFLGGSAQNIGVSTKIIYHPKMMVKSHRGQSTSIEGGHQLKKKINRHEGSVFQSVGVQVVDWHEDSGLLFSLFFSSSFLRHNIFSQNECSNQKTYIAKVDGSGHFGFCRWCGVAGSEQGASAPLPLGCYSILFLLHLVFVRYLESKIIQEFVFVICMNRAIEKRAKQSFKNHRKPRNQQNKSLPTLFCLTLLIERKKFLFSSKHFKHNHIFWTDKGTIFFLFLFTNKGGGGSDFQWKIQLLVRAKAPLGP